ncbi:MAG: hypothetical protein ACXAAP_03385 [Candidatus Thorarchaeota archaeon]|jgi:hypothetical protein
MNYRNSAFDVRIPREKGRSQYGVLRWNKKGPTITLRDGSVISGNTSFLIHQQVVPDIESVGRMELVEPEIKIKLKPILIASRRYVSGARIDKDTIYPPASYSWTSRILPEGEEALFAIQETDNPRKYWLTIFVPKTGECFESHLVHRYEASQLSMVSDLETWVSKMDSFAGKGLAKTLEQFQKCLDGPAPQWSEVSYLTEEVTIPNLHRGNSMREFVAQLVPDSLSQEVKEQFMLFLAWAAKREIPVQDPIEFLNDLAPMYILRSLVIGHLQCLIDQVKTPPYVKILQLAATDKLTQLIQPISADPERVPWLKIRNKLWELFPNRLSRVIEIAKELNQSEKVYLRSPVSVSATKESKTALSDRIATLSEFLHLRGYIQHNLIGLKELVYVGHAHGWPHNHLAYSGRSIVESERPLHVDVMIAPQTAAERLIRVRPSVSEIAWSTTRINLELYNEKRKVWTTSLKRILNSIHGKRSFKQLKKEFNVNAREKYHAVSKKEVKVLDIVSQDHYLTWGESENYWKYWGLTEEEVHSTIEGLIQAGVLRVEYMPVRRNLKSILIVAQGPQETLCSLTRALLKHTPSTTAFIERQAKTSFLLSRFPKDNAINIMSELSSQLDNSSLNTRLLPIDAYTGYRHNLYTRLYKDSGSWDDNIEGLLSQIRVPHSTAEIEK